MPILSQRGPTGRMATLVVAASDASSRVKAQADYVCDGAGDQEEIQAAIDALPTAGGSVVLSEGTFTMEKVGVASSPPEGYCLLIDQNAPPTTLWGQGPSTILQLVANEDADTSVVLIRGDSGDERTNPTLVADLTIDGNAPNQVNPWTDYADLEIAYAYDVEVRGASFQQPNVLSARPFRQSERCAFRDCRFLVNTKTGLRLECVEAQVLGCVFRGANTASGDLLVVACNDDVGVQADGLLIAGCMFKQGLHQATLNGAIRSTVAHNIFRDQTDNSGFAVAVTVYDATSDYEGENVLVAHNQIYNARIGVLISASNAVAALYCKYNIVAYNSIIDGPDASLAYGVWEAGNYSDWNIIEHNLIRGASTAVSTVGVNTIVQDNVS